jgi:hypothetical protein
MASASPASADRNHVADVTHDGRADLIGWNDASKWVQLSTGSGFSAPQDWSEGTPLYGSRADLVGDVNGDGRADLIGWNDASKWVQLSTGSGFTGPQDWSEGTPFYGSRANLTGDVNGDGRADLIGWNDASKWVQLSTGSGFTAPQDWSEGTPFYGSSAAGPGGDAGPEGDTASASSIFCFLFPCPPTPKAICGAVAHRPTVSGNTISAKAVQTCQGDIDHQNIVVYVYSNALVGSLKVRPATNQKNGPGTISATAHLTCSGNAKTKYRTQINGFASSGDQALGGSALSPAITANIRC